MRTLDAGLGVRECRGPSTPQHLLASLEDVAPLRVTFSFSDGLAGTVLLSSTHPLRVQRLQSLHAHFSALQGGDAFGGGSEVSLIYGLKPNPKLLNENDGALKPEQVTSSLDQLYALRNSALTGAATAGLGLGLTHQASLTDWVRATTAPTLWPVMGPITGAFGERIDPFNGEGAFHSGIDISCHYGQPVLAPSDGVVTYAGPYNGYGRMIQVDHGNGITTRGHLSGFTVAGGQTVRRGRCSATSASADAAPGRTCTMKCASTTHR